MSKETKTCRTCKQVKSVALFYSTSRVCKECISKKNKRARSYATHDDLLNITDELLHKKCIGCQQEKVLEAFERIKNGKYVDRKPRCKECEKFAARQRKAAREEERKRLERENLLSMSHRERIETIQRRHMEHSIKQNYGISLERYNFLLEAQNGVCAICHEAPEQYSRLVVDHDHRTGAVRGLLCTFCNFGIGFLKDDPERLIKAAKYLQDSTWDCD